MQRQTIRKSTATRSQADPLLRPPVSLQTKLKVGARGDGFEREADRVANEVLRDGNVEGPRQHMSDGREGLADAPESVGHALRTPGAPLDAATRNFMEPRFGHDFAHVRVHSGATAAESADTLGARAFTVGEHIVFGAGEYRPGSAEGRQLLAHELTHVTQQGASAPARVQRDDKDTKPKKPKAGTAAAAAKLDFQPAKNTPPGACLVFMHHDEANAHLLAQLMHAHCRYNLAIVSQNTPGARRVKLGSGTIDPNELFPKEIAEECWANDQPCLNFLELNRDAKKTSVIEEYMQRQFFLSIKGCSNGFQLPVIGLHNNAVGDTERYRAALKTRAKTLEAEAKKDPTKAPSPVAPDIEGIRGKTFVTPGETTPAGSVPSAPFAELEKWLKDNVKGVQDRDPKVPDKIKHKKPTIKTPPQEKDSLGNDKPELLTPKQTNIFLWCSADDNTLCHIGDPERPDNVVWVTNRKDFEKLAGTKVNVALQTTDTDTDLSTLFVKLPKISDDFMKFRDQLDKNLPLDAKTVETNYDNLRQLYDAKGLFSGDVWGQASDTVGSAMTLAKHWLQLLQARSVKKITADDLHFVNIETPNQPTRGESAKDHRVEAFHDVKATLATLGFDFCDASAPAGTDSPVKKVETGMREKKAPKS